jgi:hypothetical protein
LGVLKFGGSSGKRIMQRFGALCITVITVIDEVESVEVTRSWASMSGPIAKRKGLS